MLPSQNNYSGNVSAHQKLPNDALVPDYLHLFSGQVPRLEGATVHVKGSCYP